MRDTFTTPQVKNIEAQVPESFIRLKKCDVGIRAVELCMCVGSGRICGVCVYT